MVCIWVNNFQLVNKLFFMKIYNSIPKIHIFSTLCNADDCGRVFTNLSIQTDKNKSLWAISRETVTMFMVQLYMHLQCTITHISTHTKMWTLAKRGLWLCHQRESKLHWKRLKSNHGYAHPKKLLIRHKS